MDNHDFEVREIPTTPKMFRTRYYAPIHVCYGLGVAVLFVLAISTSLGLVYTLFSEAYSTVGISGILLSIPSLVIMVLASVVGIFNLILAISGRANTLVTLCSVLSLLVIGSLPLSAFAINVLRYLVQTYPSFNNQGFYMNLETFVARIVAKIGLILLPLPLIMFFPCAWCSFFQAKTTFYGYKNSSRL